MYPSSMIQRWMPGRFFKQSYNWGLRTGSEEAESVSVNDQLCDRSFARKTGRSAVRNPWEEAQLTEAGRVLLADVEPHLADFASLSSALG